MPSANRETIALTGISDEEDLTNQLIDLVPPEWTATEAKSRGGTFWALMGAIGQMMGFIKFTSDQIRKQFRLRTATFNYLDLFARDYFSAQHGLKLVRLPNEPDDLFRGRIAAEILRPKATVQGIRASVRGVTGVKPIINEHMDINTYSAWAGSTLNGSSVVPFGTPGSVAFPSYASQGGTDTRQFQLVSGANPQDRVPSPGLTLTVVDSSLTLWIESDNTDGHHNHAMFDGTPITVWKNLAPSFQGSDFTQPNAALQPKLSQNAVGTLSAVRFSVSAVNTLLSTLSTGFQENWSAFVAYRFRDANINFFTRNVLTCTGGSIKIGTGAHASDYTMTFNSPNPWPFVFGSGTPVASQYNVLQTLIHNGGNTPSKDISFQSYLSGRPTARLHMDIVNTGENHLWSNFEIGTIDAPLGADIFAILVYRRELSEAERLAVEFYLMNKWAIPAIYPLSPNTGVGGYGGRQLGNPYNFWVFVTDNPNGASPQAIASVVARTKPIGTIEHIFVRR